MRDQRLNPFAFPPETNVRFVLFILAALAVSGYVAFVGIYARVYPLDESAMVGKLTSNAQFSSQVGESLHILTFQASVVGLVLILAAVMYFLHPTYIRRRKKLKLWPSGKDPLFEKKVLELAELARVIPMPAIEFADNSRSINAQAFGFGHKYVLRLDRGLRLLMRKSPTTFQAIILHELGHIANGDVSRSYFSLAIWLVVSLLVGGSLLIFSVFSDSYDLNDIGIWLQVGAMFAVVTAIWAGLLRVREFYADWRATTVGAGQSLATIIERMIPQENERAWKKLWRFHPTAQERLICLQHPAMLFHAALDMPFLSGCLLAFILTGSPFILLSIVTGLGSGVTLGQSALLSVTGNLHGAAAVLVVLPGILVIVASILPLIFVNGYLIAGTVGLQVQRAAVAEMTTGQQGITGFLRLGLLSALVAGGLEFGFLITPIPVFSPFGSYWGGADSNPLLMIPWIILWLTTVTGFIWLGLLYVRFFGKRLTGSHLGQSPPKWKYRFLTLTLSGWLSLTFLPLLTGRITILYGQSLGTSETKLLMSITAIGLVVMLFLYVTMFGFALLIGLFTRSSCCPMCGKKVQYKVAAVETCKHCGKRLTPWLLV